MMINIDKANELHAQAADLLRSEQLMDAFGCMRTVAEEAADWNLRSELENMENNYRRMLQFLKQDMADPEREEMYRGLLEKGLVLNDRLLRAVHLQVGTQLYYRTMRELIKSPHPKNFHDLCEWVKEMGACLPEEGTLPEPYTEMQTILFNILWTSDIWSPNDRQLMAGLLGELPEMTASLCVSAVTLGLMEMYDPQKYLFLFDAYRHPATPVNQRAAVGLVMGCLMHDNRMRNSRDIRHRVEDATEDAQFVRDVQEAQMQIIRSRETEKISKFMNEEFLPEMMKNPILKKDKTGLDSLAVEDTLNPEWEKWIESKDVKDKMNIMSELYSAGADIHMASFANMKNFPFFREAANWFLPFNTRHPAVAPSTMNVGEDGSRSSFIRQIIEGSDFCDSDCYSLYLFFAGLPQGTRQMMGAQIPTLSDEVKEQLKQIHERLRTRKTQCKKYAQNVYRFYKLFARRHEFTDIFKEETNLQFCDTLLPLVSSPEHIEELAHFLFNQKHYEEAELMFSSVELATTPTAEISQKRGFCMQQFKRYDEAVERYETADLIQPDNLWTNVHLAQCYNAKEEPDRALRYYLKAEAVAPDDLNLQLQTGSCLAKVGKYDEAFKRFFKVHYLNEKSVTVWRAIAWYSLMAGKMEQAFRFYSMIEEQGGELQDVDWLNIGHFHWLNARYSTALGYYSRCIALTGYDTFKEMLQADAGELLLMNLCPTDIPLILDLTREEGIVNNG